MVTDQGKCVARVQGKADSKVDRHGSLSRRCVPLPAFLQSPDSAGRGKDIDLITTHPAAVAAVHGETNDQLALQNPSCVAFVWQAGSDCGTFPQELFWIGKQTASPEWACARPAPQPHGQGTDSDIPATPPCWQYPPWSEYRREDKFADQWP